MSQTALLPLSAKLDSAIEHHHSGNTDAAIGLYCSVLNEDCNSLDALHLLGVLEHQQGRTERAIELLQRAASIAAQSSTVEIGHAAIHSTLGNVLRAAGRPAEARVAYSRALVLEPTSAELHINLGNAETEDGDLPGAIASYRLALELAPGHASALLNLACVLIEKSAAQEALKICRQLVAISPGDPSSHFLLGRALSQTGDNGGAILSLQQCLKLDPEHSGAMQWLGTTLARIGMTQIAVRFLEHAAMLQPDDANIFAELGNAYQELGDALRATACFRRHGELTPLRTWRASQVEAEFSVLAITSPGVANTPPDFLFSNAPYDTHFYSLLAGVAPDDTLLSRHGDIVINLISDADQAHNILKAAASLSDRLTKPTVNHPRKILRTDRESVAALLSEIERCNMPQTTRIERGSFEAGEVNEVFADLNLTFPLLLRVPGSHGGEEFEKADTAHDAEQFIATHDSDVLYATRYVDYSSADGHFRKYRLVVTDEEILPYHLAIGDHWKVHHYTTEMGQHVWMQDEEKRFLETPELVFSPEHYAAMAEIRNRIGLDFFGIDCSLDHDGNLLIFEVNASILIHNDNADFPYKTPACLRVRQAFQAMLKRAAAKAVRAGGA